MDWSDPSVAEYHWEEAFSLYGADRADDARPYTSGEKDAISDCTCLVNFRGFPIRPMLLVCAREYVK